MSLKKNVFDIIKYCNEKNCEKAKYAKLVTGGNDPSITKAMKYSQYVNNSKSGSVLYKVNNPDPPTNINASPGINSAYIRWSPPDYYGRTKILYYIVHALPTSNNMLLVKQISYTNSLTISGLKNGEPYSFNVIAVNTVGSSVSSVLSNTIIPRIYPATPNIISFVSNARNQATLTWYFSPNDSGIYNNGEPMYNGGSDINSYIITNPTGSFVNSIPLTNVNIVSVIDFTGKQTVGYNTTILGLNSGSIYSFRIAAKNDAGNSPFSDNTIFITVI